MKAVFRIAGCLVAAAWFTISATPTTELETLLMAKTENFDVVQACDLLGQEVQAGVDKATVLSHALHIMRRMPMPFSLVKASDGSIKKMLSLNMELSPNTLKSLMELSKKYEVVWSCFLGSMRPHELVRFFADVVQVWEEKTCVGFAPTIADIMNMADVSPDMVKVSFSSGDVQKPA